ncbi:MAG: isochorismate synthase [Phycisphaeraceae bacterium]|nr:isochorismate synthase [Phycisphaeraceae bacterium]
MSHKSTEALIDTLTTHWLSLRTQAPKDLHHIRIDGTFNGPLSNMLSAPSDRRVYWQSRDGQTESVGVGAVMEVTTSRPEDIPGLWDRMETAGQQGDTPTRFFGGTAFDTQQAPDAVWQPMGLMRFWVPHVMLLREKDHTHLVVSTTTLDDSALAQAVQCVKSTLQAQANPSQALPVSHRCDVEPTLSQWQKRVTAVTQDLAEAQGKLVLSVRRSHRLSGRLEALQLFQRMQSQGGGGFQYYFQVDDNAFMGVSPECLYERQVTHLATEALAGTAKLDSGLLDNPKENCEHDFVIRDMQEALASVCSEFVCQPNKELLKWQDLVHLKTALTGTLKAGVTDAQIIQALHPSAAVLGYPRDKAWQWLHAYEDHARGWYAGPVGWLERDRAQFAVALRCAIVASNQIHFYAGAGLVPASRPLEEWQEVQNKMRFFQEILEG